MRSFDGVRPVNRDRPSSETRRRAYVAAARDAFFHLGYASTTMSFIANKVGGSKTTLWSYFASKEALFAAVVDDIIALHGKAASAEFALDRPVEDILQDFGLRLLDTLYSPPIISLHRLIAGEADRFPHLAALFEQRGPARGRAKFVVYLEAKMDEGVLRQGDAMLACRQFGGLCQGGLLQSVFLGVSDPPDVETRRKEVAAAVTTFCCAWKHGSGVSLSSALAPSP